MHWLTSQVEAYVDIFSNGHTSSGHSFSKSHSGSQVIIHKDSMIIVNYIYYIFT